MLQRSKANYMAGLTYITMTPKTEVKYAFKGEGMGYKDTHFIVTQYKLQSSTLWGSTKLWTLEYRDI